ncbi:MAG: COX15/CtaA family protein [Acidobacteriota bacterium]|nr:COX15/CtaA family protein [Acidobacteriota bacterium]
MKLNRLAAFAWGVVAWNLLVIVWGAYVRASVSGDGCGSHWPLCNGEVIPDTGLAKTLIELTHRLTSGVALVLVLALVICAFRAYPKRHRVRRGAVWSLIFILIEALIGAALVRFELVAGNASMSRAVVMSVHLVNTFLLLGALSLTAWWAGGAPALKLRGQGRVSALLAVGLLGTLLLAVSGAVAALGDTLFPATSLAEAFKQDMSPTAHILLRLRVLHPTLAVLVGCYILVTSSYLSNFLRPDLWTKRLMSALVALLLTQLAAGLLNVYLLAPIPLQLLHLFLADALWIALILFAASATSIADCGLRIQEMRRRQHSSQPKPQLLPPKTNPQSAIGSVVRVMNSQKEG